MRSVHSNRFLLPPTDPKTSVKGALMAQAFCLASKALPSGRKIDIDVEISSFGFGTQTSTANRSPKKKLALQPDFERSELWARATGWKIAITSSMLPVMVIYMVGLAVGVGNDISAYIDELSASSELDPAAVVETITATLALIHLLQFVGFGAQSGIKFLYMHCDLVVLTHHVTELLREAEFYQMEDARSESRSATKTSWQISPSALQSSRTSSRGSCSSYANVVHTFRRLWSWAWT